MTTELSYYPGCSLHGTSEEYDQSIRAVCGGLDIRLTELPDWICCGASSAHVLDEKLARLLASENLRRADRAGRDVVVPCAACYSRLKFAEKDFAPDLPDGAGSSRGSDAVRIVHIHELLSNPRLLDAIREKATRPLTDLAVVPYYGCLTVRPPRVTDSERPEDPVALDEIVEALGARVVRWPFKTDCCGGSFSLSRPEVVRKLAGDLTAAAKHAGGDCFVTDCPMCQSNLDTRQKEIEAERQTTFEMPVFFITELIALAMGLGGMQRWLAKHLVDPRPLLRRRSLM